MAIPKKRSRTISVEGIEYRYVGYLLYYDCPGDHGFIIVELSDSPKEKIRAEFSYEKIGVEYKRIGKKISRYIDHMPPFLVRHSVLYALEKGWNPSSGGGIRELGCLDSKIDFSKLTEID